MLCLRCSMQGLWLRRVGSSPLTRHLSWAPCIGSTESWPLDPQGRPIRAWFYAGTWSSQAESSYKVRTDSTGVGCAHQELGTPGQGTHQ